MIIPAADQNNYSDSLQTLCDQLNEAYWYATTVEAKNVINELALAVSDLLTQLNQGQLDSNTGRYTELQSRITAVNEKLQKVQSQINDWIHAIAVATQLAKAIDQTVRNAARVIEA